MRIDHFDVEISEDQLDEFVLEKMQMTNEELCNFKKHRIQHAVMDLRPMIFERKLRGAKNHYMTDYDVSNILYHALE